MKKLNTLILLFALASTTAYAKSFDGSKAELKGLAKRGQHTLSYDNARAAILGRDYVTPDDVKELCIPVLNHRIIMKAEAELEGLTTTAIINRILSEVEVPM